MSTFIMISIIIPIYNCKEYLEYCIKSVLCQTLKELEIICVDDGSVDNSMEIVQRIQRVDNRIILKHQENQGAGAARNAALKIAKGKYVIFLDADDYYKEENALELMVRACERKSVLVCASRKKCLKYDCEETVELFPKELTGKVLEYKDYQMDFYYQNYLIQRELLIKNNIYFPLYRRYQDPPFFVKTLFAAKKFTVIDTCLYCYRMSDVIAKFNTQKTIDMLKGIVDNLTFAKQHDLSILFCDTAGRLETDSGIVKIIYENISMEALELVELLVQANRIIREQYQKPDYIIKPLRLLLFNIKQYVKSLIDRIKIQNKIAVYGAGWYAKILLEFLRNNGLFNRIKYIVVTHPEGNPSSIEGIPIISFERFLTLNENFFLLIALNQKNSKEVINFFKEKNFIKYTTLDELFWELLLEN